MLMQFDKIGVTPFVNPDDLKFFFQEIHRLAGNSSSKGVL